MKRHPLYEAPLAQVARTLYEAINETEDPATLKILNSITFALRETLDRELIKGTGMQLWIWVGLKLDAPDMGATYGDGIKKGYPEVFTGRTYKERT